MRFRAIMVIVLIGVLLSPIHSNNLNQMLHTNSDLDLGESSADSDLISLDAAPLFLATPDNVTYEHGYPYGEVLWDAADKAVPYIFYVDGEENKTGDSGPNTNILFILTGYSEGLHNITIILGDLAGEYTNDTLWLEVLTPTAPVFLETPGETYEFENSVTVFSLQWNFSDHVLQDYTIYRNGTEKQGDSYLYADNETNILVSRDLLGLNDLQVYNFTIVVTDFSGLSSSETTLVTPLPAEAPSIISRPDTYSAAEQNDYVWLNWTATDLNPNSYTLYQNNVSIATGVWINEEPISYLSHGLAKEDYNFTISIIDTSGNEVVDTVWLSVYDEVNPNFISTPVNLNYTYSATGNALTWEVNDSYPGEYQLFINDVLTLSTSWINEGQIMINVDGNNVGIYNYTIVIFDESGNTIKDTAFVEVLAIGTKAPTISYSPTLYFSDSDTFSGTWNDTNDLFIQGANIHLELTDNNSQVFYSLNFISQTDINGYFEISLDYSQILPGNYTWSLTFSETGYNSAMISFEIIINSMGTSDPSVLHNMVVTVREIDTLSGTWTDMNSAFIVSGTAQITLYDDNSQLVPDISYQSITNTNGYFEFSLDYSDILPGNYTWELLLSKTGYVSTTIILEVSVLPLDVDLSVLLGSILTQHEEYLIYTNVTSSGGIQSSLMLNEFGEPISGVQVKLEVSILLTNSSQTLILLTAITNSSGIATFILSADQTLVIQQILGITATVDDPYVSETSTEVNNSELPEVKENVIIPGTTPPTTTPTDENPDNTSQLLTIALIAVSAIALVLIVLRVLSGKRESGELERQLLEFYFIRNIQLLLIKNLNGLPVFEKKFSQLETDPTLLAGLSHALSMFIDEVSKGGGQVEYLERGDFSLISVRGTNTIMTIVSGSGFPKRFNDQIIDACTQIEADVFPNVSDQITMISSSDDKAVFEILDYHGIPVGLLDKLMIDTKKLEKATNGFSSSPAFEILSSYSEYEFFQLDRLIDGIEAIGTSQEEMAKIILEAYASKIITPYVPQSEL